MEPTTTSKSPVIGIIVAIIAIVLVIGGVYLAERRSASRATVDNNPPLTKSDTVSSIASDLQNTAPANVDLSGLNQTN